ncbi:MAG: hypothetical protein Q7T56_18945 [Nocardioidaceae bacterium]|nr:hypothetical protein [Nocardioidaceae bacterium]
MIGVALAALVLVGACAGLAAVFGSSEEDNVADEDVSLEADYAPSFGNSCVDDLARAAAEQLDADVYGGEAQSVIDEYGRSSKMWHNVEEITYLASLRRDSSGIDEAIAYVIEQATDRCATDSRAGSDDPYSYDY